MIGVFLGPLELHQNRFINFCQSVLQKMEVKSQEVSLNAIFDKLEERLPLSLELKICSEHVSGLEDSGQFSKECIKTKIKIIQILLGYQNKIEGNQFKMICSKLKVLACSDEFLENEGLINLYLDVYDLKKKGKRTANRQMAEISYKFLRCLQGLIKFFFLKNEVNQYRKYKKQLPSSFCGQIQGIDQVMELKIKKRVFSKKCVDLFKQYLKSQQVNNKKELCRVCYKSIQIQDISKHVDLCGKKTYIKQQLIQNFQKRLEILSQLQVILFEQKQKQKNGEDQKNLEDIQKVIKFYKSLRKNKNSKRMSIRYQDQNPPLFFKCNPHKENEKQHQFMVLLCSLQDKAFCLNKKLEQVESQFNKSQNKNKAKDMKISVDIPFKKHQSMCKKNTSQIKFDLIQEFKDEKIQEIKEQQDQNEPPVIARRTLKKKFSEYARRFSSASQKSNSNASQNQYNKISLKNFEILKLLGKGAFGRVYLARRKKTNDIYALKAIRIDKNWGENQLQSIKNQYSIYKKIEGDHLVTATFSFHEKNVQFFVLQYMPRGDLSKFLEENVYLQQKEAQFYLAEILLAIEHLHKSQIVHRDLKPQNIVLDSKGHLKLTDFGLSECRVKNKISKALEKKNLQQKQQSLKISLNKKSFLKNRNEKKIIGTPDYIAPEIIQGTCLTNPIIDWWSFGVIAYEMMIGSRPFSANSVQVILANIEKGQLQWPEQEGMISQVAVSFIESLLTKNYEDRLGFNGVQQIKNHKFFEGIDWLNLKKSNPPLLTNDLLNQNLESLSDDKNLRSQIEILMEKQVMYPLQELKNYVRYDLLTAETLESAKEGAIQKERRIKKLKSIASNFEHNEPKVVKGVVYKPALSSQDQNSS